MKICIYFMHAQTLGETQRVRSIASYLSKEHEVLVVNAGVEMDLGDLKSVTLPHGFYEKANHRTQTFRGLKPNQLKERAVALLKTVSSFDPDVFITKSFPFQYSELKFELVPTLKWIKGKGKRLISSLGYSLGTATFAQGKPLLDLYDQVLVHCPKELDPKYIAAYYGNEAWNEYLLSSDKTVYTGYILPEESRDVEFSEDGVFVSRGSGVVNDNMMLPSVEAALEMGLRCEAVNGMIGGEHIIPLLKEKGIVVHEHLDQRSYTQELAKAKYSVSMCGYGTGVQLLWTKKRGVLIPKLIDKEQWYRAEMLAEILGSKILKKPKKEDIKEALESLEQKEIIIKEEWFDGLQNTLEEINGITNN